MNDHRKAGAASVVTDGDLPEGWAEVTLDQLLTSLESGSRPRGGVRGIKEGVPSIGGEHLADNGGFRFENVKYVPERFFGSMNRGHIQLADILVVKDGATTGKVSLVRKNFPYDPAVVNEHVFLCRPIEGFFSPFIFYFLFSQEGQDRILANFRGSAQGGINQSFAPGTSLPIAPFAEQKRIVGKVEELLARVNVAKERLAKLSQILKCFRQSVLAAACSGRLTEDWRERNSTQTKAGCNMDNTGSQPGWREEVPETWECRFLRDVADCRLGKMLDKQKNRGIPTPYLRNVNVRWFAFDLTDLSKIKVDDAERTRYLIENGDVLVCEGGEPGRAAVWREGKSRLVFQKALHRVRLPKHILPEWLVYNLKHDADNDRLSTLFTGSTIKHLTGKAFNHYPVFIPPSEEQHEIVRRVETLFKLADTIEERVKAATKRTEKLTQSILAKAFRGELVPTEAELARLEDRNYETATELLARICCDRKQKEKTINKRRKTKHKPALRSQRDEGHQQTLVGRVERSR